MGEVGKGRLYNAGAMALYTVVSGLAIYKGFSELSADAFYQPVIQGLLAFFGALGIGAATARLTAVPKQESP